MVVNVAMFDGARRPDVLLRLALREPGRLFIGVELMRAEAHRLLEHSQHGVAEGTARVVGRRQRRARKNQKAKP